MKFLAQFVMRGYPQAALAAAATALLSLLLPLFAVLSSGAVSLFALRSGVREGAVLVGIATLGLGALAALAVGAPGAAAGVLLVMWLPALVLAAVLRGTRSLALTVEAGGVLGILAVLGIHGLVDDPAARWLSLMGPFQETLVADGVLAKGDAEVLFPAIAAWMTGSFVAALVLQWLGGLLLGRWWQALLYNPGGFGEEFRNLRLHAGTGLIGAVLLTWVSFTKGPGLIPDLLVVLLPLFLLQGLAVIHQLHLAFSAHWAWLMALYLALAFVLPHGILLVACIGLVDIGADLRRRLARPAKGGD